MSAFGGPLQGVRVLEFAGIGPGPFCGMLLSDLGADVIRIDRKDAKPPSRFDVMSRGRTILGLDLKVASAKQICLDFMSRADIVFEGYRPGVMEKLGLGPDAAFAVNPRLVYGRMTGWGQHGPLAQRAGHDINYIAISGALHAIGVEDKPVPPLNLVGDLGGGALYLAFGMLAALTHARATGQGQVVDAAMSDGAASLMAMMYGFLAAGDWRDQRRANLIDGGAHFYDTYRCSDGNWIALGAIEPQFYALMLKKVGLPDDAPQKSLDTERWPVLKHELARIIALRSRDEWTALLEDSDVCFAPVLSMTEAPHHPHNQARATFVEIDDVMQPAPAPRFSATPGSARKWRAMEENLDEALRDWDFAAPAMAALKQRIGQR